MKDLTGMRFGKLVAISPDGKQGSAYMWKCRCDCGNEKRVRGNNLTSGQVTSCGCGRKGRSIKHSGSKTRLYRIWYGIIRRTEDASREEYGNYGGRGIRMCAEWRNDFAVFRDWALANGYNDTLSIDRIDADGDYEPGNCRWTTKTEQENNKRGSFMLTVNGETRTAAEWAKVSGITADRIRKRKRKGWSDSDAVLMPLNTEKQHPQK